MHRDSIVYKFDKIVVQLLENFAQDVTILHGAINRQLMHNIKKNPALLMQLIAKSPGMHADLLMGRMDALAQKFQHLGVDVQQITNQIAHARDLLQKQAAGKHVPVKKALPVNENAQMDYYFEDLYHITDDKMLLDGIRKKLETPELKQKLGPANAGNAVEMVYKYIKDRQHVVLK